MGLRRIEEFHTDPGHVEKIRQAKYGMKKREFPFTMVIAFLLGCLITYLAFMAVALIPNTSEPVYLQGGGLMEALPLAVFALIMAISFVPIAFPAPFFLIAGVLLLVPAVHWCAKKLVFHTRRLFHKPSVPEARLYHLRQI